MKILLVDDEVEILEILKEFLEMEQHIVLTAENGKQALDYVLSDPGIEVVFSDIKMPVMDGLAFLEKLRVHENTTPVVLVSGQGDLDSSIKALQLGALDFIVKPVHLKSLTESLHKIETAVELRQESRVAVPWVKEQALKLSFESQIAHIRNAVSYLSNQTHDICQSYDLDVRKLAICLQECLVNAIVHGNFGLDSQLKENDWAAYDQMIKERESQPSFSQLQVEVRFALHADHLLLEIADQGKGFDPKQLPDPSDPSSWLRLSGRGILFVRTYMDEVYWNDSGNKIFLKKNLAQ